MRIVLWTVLLFLPQAKPAASAKPLDRSTAEDKLKILMVKKVAIQCVFYKSNDLHFDSTGKLLGHSEAGSWTAFAGIEIDSVKVGRHSVVFTGRRNVRRWEGDELINYTLDDPVRIELDLPQAATEGSLVSSLERVFLVREQRLSDVVPDFWKVFLTTERNRSAALQKQQAALMKNVKAVSQDITPPKLLSAANGITISSSPFPQVDDNTFVASFIVDRSGAVKDVQIVKPVGVGVDDAIAEKIAQWKFSPALSGSDPEEVLMYARISIKLPQKRQVNPSRGLPCPVDAMYNC